MLQLVLLALGDVHRGTVSSAFGVFWAIAGEQPSIPVRGNDVGGFKGM